MRTPHAARHIIASRTWEVHTQKQKAQKRCWRRLGTCPSPAPTRTAGLTAGLADLPHSRPLLIPGRKLWTARPASSIRPGLWVSTPTPAEILIPDARRGGLNHMSKGRCGAKNFLQIMCATSAAAAVIGRRLQCECAWEVHWCGLA